MISPLSTRCLLPLLLAVLCCSCSTPEERANAAFSELCQVVDGVHEQLASVRDLERAEAGTPALEELSDSLWGVLKRLDDMADSPELTPEARRRVGETWHAPLREGVDAAAAELLRLARRALYHSRALERLYRRELARWERSGKHPWPRAVLAGREYHPRAKVEDARP